ncbi:MAG: DUF389 domain-containing protein [Oscillospiraceae bacterium]
MKKKLSEYISEYFSLTYDNASYEVIKERILSGGQVRGTNLCILMLAIFIASIGLNMNSTAVIIGAMLISPLMGGIMAIGYCIATNDMKSALQFSIRLVLQVVISLVTSYIYFTLSPISTAHSELLARTNPTIWDVLIAFFGGLAGIIGTTRQEKGNVLPGVAIATALMPPLCTAGYGLSIHSMDFFLGAMYLFFINSFFICLSTILVLKIMKVPEYKPLSHRARKRVHTQIIILACITITPSIYLAYQMTDESIRDSHVDKYIQENFNFENTDVIQTNISDNTIEIALLGETIDSQTLANLESKLVDYDLDDMTLKITQTETNSSVDNEKLKELIQSLINNNVDIASFKDFMKYQTTTIDTNKSNSLVDFSQLAKEIQSLYPSIDSCSIGYIDKYLDGKLSNEVKSTIVIMIDEKDNFTSKDLNQLNSWLKTKLINDNFVIIENPITIGSSIH